MLIFLLLTSVGNILTVFSIYSSVAIPIMLVHTFLSRRVDHIVGDMEEQAVALTNILYRESTCGGAHVE